jgi:AraC-like DNA-binding protein
MGPLPALVDRFAGFPALERAFRRSGLPLGVLDQRNTRIPLESMHTLFEAAAREVGDEYLGLNVGLRMDPFTYGDWGRYVSDGRTLGEALRRIVRTLWIHQGGARFTLHVRDEHAVWRYWRPTIAPENRRQHSLHVLPPNISLVRLYLGEAWLPSWIEFDFPQPARRAPVERAFPVEARYGRDAMGIALPVAALSAPRRDPSLDGRRVTYTDLLAAEDFASGRELRDIYGLVGMRLLDGEDDLDGLARRLGIGPRTLQRRLALHGTSYRALLDRARLIRAMSLLRETDLSVTQIALALGYQEPPNFTRAFKKMSRSTPTEFRSCSAGL